MDCCAYCTATSYQMKPFSDSLRGRYKTNLFREVLHVEVPTGQNQGDVFYFPYGVVVCWGLTKQLEEQMLNEIRPFEDHHTEIIETDEFTFTNGEIYKIVEDEIFLPNPEPITKLSASHAISQSVKLGAFEVAIQKTFNQAKQIPEDLAKKGKIALSKKEIRKKMGELFIKRNSVTLYVDVLDTPEFFWKYPELEPIYHITANYLDFKTRVEVLNHRLAVVHELFQMLGTELNNQHATRLEWIIILLIVCEVVLSLIEVFKII